MAEIFSSNSAATTIVLDSKEAYALQLLLADWIDDSYARGIEYGDETVIANYKDTRNRLTSLFEAFGPYMWPED